MLTPVFALAIGTYNVYRSHQSTPEVINIEFERYTVELRALKPDHAVKFLPVEVSVKGGEPGQIFAVNLETVGRTGPVLCRPGQPGIVTISVNEWQFGISLEVLNPKTQRLQVKAGAVYDHHDHLLLPSKAKIQSSNLVLSRCDFQQRYRFEFQCAQGYYNSLDGQFTGLPKLATYPTSSRQSNPEPQKDGPLDATFYQISKYYWSQVNLTALLLDNS